MSLFYPVNTVKDFEALLKEGCYSPSGDPRCFITHNDEIISFDSAGNEVEYCRHAIHNKVENGWRIKGAIAIITETLVCSKSGKKILHQTKAKKPLDKGEYYGEGFDFPDIEY